MEYQVFVSLAHMERVVLQLIGTRVRTSIRRGGS